MLLDPQVIARSASEDSFIDHESVVHMASVHAKHTRALLEAKKRRDSTAEGNEMHNLTRNLNRQIFQGTLTLTEVLVEIFLGDAKEGKGTASGKPPSQFDLVASNTGLALFHHTNDSKIYMSLDQITAAVRPATDRPTSSRLLLSGGSTDTLLPSHFPHLISHSMEDRFIRCSLHIGRYRNGDKPTMPFKRWKSDV